MKTNYLLSALFFLVLSTEIAFSQVTLNLKVFIQGYYLGGGQMNIIPNCTSDTLFVDLHNSTSPYAIAASAKAAMASNGTATFTFPASVSGNSYYIAVRQWSAIQTWSAVRVLFSTTTNYDFTTAACQAYGCNQATVGASIVAMYSGDVNQDGNIDLIDFPALDFGINNGLFGCYPMDYNGDGNVDLLDFPVLNANINAAIFSMHP